LFRRILATGMLKDSLVDDVESRLAVVSNVRLNETSHNDWRMQSLCLSVPVHGPLPRFPRQPFESTGDGWKHRDQKYQVSFEGLA
jgi:hypothetical protein